MSLNRFSKRRDANDLTLAKLAEQLGWFLTPLDTPCDYLGLFQESWYTIEIKLPKGPRGGVKGRALTPAQKQWHEQVRIHNGSVLIWRTLEDVVKDTEWLSGGSSGD